MGGARGGAVAAARDPYSANSIAEWSALMREGVQQALRANEVVSRNALLAALDRLDALRASSETPDEQNLRDRFRRTFGKWVDGDSDDPADLFAALVVDVRSALSASPAPEPGA